MAADDDPQDPEDGTGHLRETIRLFDIEAGGDIILDGRDLAPGDRVLQERVVYALGGVSLAGPPPVAVTLPLRPRSEIMVDGKPDLFRALSWNSVLTKLRGRDAELHELLGWATDDSRPVAMRVVSGPGGAGKTRLAAEAVLALRRAGWTAGFLPRAATSAVRLEGVGARGLFLAVDYPEEYPDQVIGDLVSSLASEDGSARPVRVLLLSRRDVGRWEHIGRRLRGRFDAMDLRGAAALPVATARDILADAADGLADLMGLPLPSLKGADSWLSPVPDEPERRLPLFAAAAGLHAVLAPSNAFGLGGAQLMSDLARRELDRVQGMSLRLGLRNQLDADSDDGLARFLALATSNGFGLDGQAILEMQALEVVPERSPRGVLKALRSTGWWQADSLGEGRLAPLAPDRLAAAFMARVLLSKDANGTGLAELLWVGARHAARGRGAAYGDAVSRLGHDLQAIVPELRATFEALLLEMLQDNPDRAQHFLDVAQSERTVFSARFAIRVLEVARPSVTDPVSKAVLLSNLSAYLSQLGNRWQALEIGREALAIRRSLAGDGSPVTAWDLAASLNNVACFLGDLDQPEEAAALCAEAVDLRRSLLAERPPPFGRSENFEQDLADALNNLATFQAELGWRGEALATIEEAAAVCRTVPTGSGESLRATLALVTENLSKRLAAVDRRDAAVAAALEACDLRRELAQMRPDAYQQSLATSLQTYSDRLCELGEHAEALGPANEALAIYRFLSADGSAAFVHRLAGTLNNLASLQLNLGVSSAALEAAEEAVQLHRSLAETESIELSPDLALALETQSSALSCEGRHFEALETILESVGIRRSLVARLPKVHLPALASGLGNLAVLGLGCGQNELALETAEEATEISRSLAASEPEVHGAFLARALNTLAGCLSESGDQEAALEAARESVDRYRSLAGAGSATVAPDLAMSLETCAKCLNDLGRFAEAVQCGEEAGAIHRHFTASLPEAAFPALARSLASLSCYQLNAGQPHSAVLAAREAVGIGRKLLPSRPELAFFLTVLAEALTEAGETEEAIAASEEAAVRYRALAVSGKGPVILDFARALETRARLATLQDEHAGAQNAREEALAAIAASDTASAGAFQPYIGMLRDNYLSATATAGREPDRNLLAALAAAQTGEVPAISVSARRSHSPD